MKQEVGYMKVKQMLWKKLMNSRYLSTLFHFQGHTPKYKIFNSSLTEEKLSEQIQSMLVESKCKAAFETLICKIYQKNYFQNLSVSSTLSTIPIRSKSSAEERVDHIRQVRQQWEFGLLEELGAILAEANRPFLMFRYVSVVELPNICF